MSEIVDEINRLHREIGVRQVEAGEARTLLMRRTYDADVADVWDAVTSPERLARWFLPVSGELEVGGRYQLEGNAGGEILECERPTRLRVSWLMEPGFSEVELRLGTTGEGQTVFELEHVAVVPDDFWTQFGPGAGGVGWDLGLVGLDWHLHGKEFGGDAWESTPEGREAATRSAQAWGQASLAAGESPELVARQVAATTEFYTAG